MTHARSLPSPFHGPSVHQATSTHNGTHPLHIMASTNIEVESGDLVRLVLQFLKENNLTRSMETLQKESEISLNTVESVDTFVSDIHNGHWDAVLKACGMLKLPNTLLYDLYEQVVFELCELRETDVARAMLRKTDVFESLKIEHPDRYLKLDHLLSKGFDQRGVYGITMTKERKRQQLADALVKEVSVVPPSRLLALLQQALKWQQHTGQLPPGTEIDLFRGKSVEQKQEEDMVPKKLDKEIKFGKTHAEVGAFSPDGQHLVTGSADGFIEVWNYQTGKLKKSELKYQKEDEFMMHNDAILTLDFSRDSEMLASGCSKGLVKVWQVKSGKCLRRFDMRGGKDKSQNTGITSVAFSRDGSQVLSCSFDFLARIHGLKSGKTLKLFRGHTSFVNCGLFSSDGSKVLTASSDGTVKIWNAKTTDNIASFRPPQDQATLEPTIHNIKALPRHPDQFIVCNSSSTLFIINLRGQLIRSMSANIQGIKEFVHCCPSPRGMFIHAVGEDMRMHSFDVKSGECEQSLKVSEKQLIGVAHHPHTNLVATWGDDNVLKLWKA
eukprot:TRINITY_DN257_c1_g2_i1.p1 TRINITY_DN257_c1_g2~~TRINITY_DN257_c1_g2_i1.p1  ORF type:complete len:553 (+),score=158.85 TRINITY_DN257_c1_g2_i1:82-1740(+)